jgi:putative membrane protein
MDFTWAPHITWGWIFPLLCLFFMLAMMIMMFRRGGGCMPFGGGHRGRMANDGETPRQILDRRYASGQISKEQYAEMRGDLSEPLEKRA